MRIWFSGPRIFGIRTGISFGPADFARTATAARPATAARSASPARPNALPAKPLFDADHSFIYVITDNKNRCRIGLTEYPNATLQQVRAAARLPVSLAWIGAPKEEAVAIERDACAMLATYRSRGEWFNVTADAAVGAIAAAAQRRGHPMLGLTPEQAEQIRLTALAMAASGPGMKRWHKIALWTLASLAAAIIGLIIIGTMNEPSNRNCESGTCPENHSNK
jgi:hypothetical protein